MTATDGAWTPAAGTRDLVERYGQAEAFTLLADLLGGLPPASMAEGVYADALRSIGGGLFADAEGGPPGGRLRYWPRAWAARSFGHLGDMKAAPLLAAALSDAHWRVRMNAATSLGWLGARAEEPVLVAALSDPHPRVRAAVAPALERVGSDLAMSALDRAQDDPDERVQEAVQKALDALREHAR